MKKPVSRAKAASKPSPKKPRAATSLKKPRAASKAKPASRTTVKPATKPIAAKKAKGLWPSLSIGLAAAGDAAAVGASLLACLAPKGDASGLYAHLAKSLGAQFAGATAPARRRAAKPLGGESIDAAREILERLKAYLEAANLIRARGAEIDAIFVLLDKTKQRKFQSALDRLMLAVTQERNIADLPALVSAAIDGVIGETEVPKKRKPRKG
ncbi:MAG: hypothetical protein JWN73_2267 [Betaproteobacteria bacterium]|nr:hypothetical protein [Betaproteobacteria bacterium]